MGNELNASPEDRDLAIRTIIGEAGNQSDEGMAGVASVINNRVRAGSYGNSPSEVVLAPNQFEPWQTRRKELMGYRPDSPEYQRAASVYDKVVSGDIPDPTGGATHFLNPKVVAARRGGTLPDWAQGQGKQIGDHTFYKPGGDSLFDKYDPDQPQPTAAASSADFPLLDKYDQPTEASTEKNGRLYVTSGKYPSVAVAKGEAANRVISSMPVVGPLAQRAIAGGFALAQGGLNRLRGQPADIAQSYDNNLQTMQGMAEDYGQTHPGMATAADMAGSAAVLGPLAASAPGASALGLTGTSLGTQVLKGGATLAGIETGNQLLRGNDPREQGLLGPVPVAAVTGAAGPIIGEGVRILGNNLVKWARPPAGPLRETNSVTRGKLADAMDAETPASIAASKEAHGSAGILADTNQATRDIAGGLADIPGPAKGEIRETLRQRAAGQTERLMQSLDQNTVRHVNTRDLISTVENSRSAEAKPLYDAFRSTKIRPTKEIQDLIPRLKAAGAFKLADELAGIRGVEGTEKFFVGGPQKEFPTAETWDLVKRGLDRRISSALDSDDKTLARELMKLKGDMLTEVEKTPGGQIWKKARETFAEHSELLHQLEEGQKTWNRTTRVDDLANELKDLSYSERAARMQGARDAVHEIMTNTVNGATTARNKLLTQAGRQKLELLFGPQKAERLIKDLEAEVNISKNTEELVGGTQTAPKQARRDALLPQKKEPGYFANIDLAKPSTLMPDWMHPRAMFEGAAEVRHAQARNELGKIMQVPMRSPSYDDLVGAMRAEGARRATGSVVSAQRGRAATRTVQTTVPALENRLSRPQNSEPELEGSRL